MAKFLDLEGLNYFWAKIKSWVQERFAYKSDLNQKQNKLVSGQNIKTINNQDILGQGNIEIQSGGAVDSVNGKTGDVVLDAEDVNALPKSTTIPTKVSDLTNDSGFITTSDIPTNVSDFNNDAGYLTSFTETDPTVPSWAKQLNKPSYNYSEIGNTPDLSGFITKSVNDLTNYYLKSETYTKAEVAALIGAIQQFHYEIYPTLPQSGESNVLYLIGPTGSGADKYEEYVYSNNAFTKIGDTSIDLSGYVTTSALNTALASYATTQDLEDSKVFWAEVEVTTFAEIKDAIDAGRTVMLKDDDAYTYVLSYIDDTYACFSCSSAEENLMKTYDIYDDDSWDYFLKEGVESENNKVYSISSSSVDGTYPSAKAVYDIVSTKYTKPQGGIPASDLASGVIPTIPVQDVTVGGTSVVSNGTAVIPAIPSTSDFEVSANKVSTIAGNETDTSKYPNTKAVYDAIHPAYSSSQSQDGMLPNVLYKLGTLSGSVTIAFATPADNTIENEYKFTFTADSTAPTITWPQSVTSWIGNSIDNCAPKVEADTYYEVSVLDGCGIFNKF